MNKFEYSWLGFMLGLVVMGLLWKVFAIPVLHEEGRQSLAADLNSGKCTQMEKSVVCRESKQVVYK